MAGQAAIRLPAAGQMVIDQTSSRAVIDWRGFSIGAGGVVQFNNGTGATLNRVLGGDPSSIAGQLRASGSVYLVNPAGVVVDSSGQVLTGGSFVASTRSIGADAFMAGGSLTFVGNGSGGVENRGRIETGGDAVLIGHWVTNTGSIRAGGAAGLAAGSRVVLQAAGSDARIYVEGTSGDVTTSGAVTAAAAELKAAGGNVYALAGNSGVVRATGVASEGGRILLTAGGDVTVAQGAALVADGSVTVDAGQALAVAGRISTSAGTGNTGGGRITLLANDIALTGAAIAASGSGNGSGGIVRIGGGRLGGEGLREAATLKADAATTITADGGASGNGGDVVLWSRDWTGFAGTILARGGATAGNGGEAEVSSRGILGYDGLTDLRAANGITGTLLLDPYNITISSAANSNSGQGFIPFGDNSNINVTTLTNALLSANVFVSTGLAGSRGGQAGNITVSAPLRWFSNRLTLQAAGTIMIDATITAVAGGTVNLSSGITAGDTTAIGGSGQLLVGNLSVITAGGAVTLTNAANAIRNFSAATGGGNVSLINTSALELTTINLGAGTLTISNGANAVTQMSALTAGRVNVTTSNAAVTLTESSNAISNFSANTGGGNVSLDNSVALTLGASNLGTGVLTVSNGQAAVGQTGPLTAGGVNVTTSNASVTLNDSANAISNFSATTGGGSASLTNTRALTLGSSNLGTGSLIIGNTGDITLANGSTLGSMANGDAIVLQTGGIFLSPGSGAIDTPQGRFLVFAADPSRLEIAGPLTARTAYGLSAAAYNAGTAVGPAGSRFVFANTPTRLITPTSASRVFDGTAQGLTAFTMATSGGSRFDDASEVLVGTPISQTATDVRRSGGSPTGAVLSHDIGIANLASLTSPIGYQLVGGTGQLTITPRTLVLTPLATTRVYGESNPLTNGFTVELLNGVGNALVGSDALAPTIRIASDAAATAAAGSAFDLTGIGAQFTSGNAGNYRILYDVLAGGLTITPRPITITANAQTRIYGNANPALTLAVGGMGLVNGDTLTGALATTADVRSNVGTYAITRGTLAASANYDITGFTGADLTVTQRPLTITYAAAPTTMVYGDAVPVLGGSFASAGLVNDDTLSGAPQFTTAATPASNVGLYGIIGSGLGASANYSLTVVQAPGNATALTILPAPLTVTVLAGQGKIYGDDDPALVFGAVGLKNDDTVASVMTGAIARAPGEDVTAGGYAIGQGTLAANANYTLGFAGDVFRISPAMLAVTADALRRTYGDADPALTFSVAGLKRTDTLSSLLTGTLVRAPGNNVGSYAISKGSLTLASSNYKLGFTGSSLTIDPAVLTFTANAASRVYGGSNPRFTGTLTGFVNGETQRTATTGTMVFTTTATAASDVGSYAISGSGLSAQNYIFAQAASNDTALTITPRPLAVAASARTRVYGDANPVLTYRASGLVNGDSLTGVLATEATPLSDVGSYAITQGTLMASANYILSFTGSQLTINPRPITVWPNAISRVYGNDNPVLTFRIGGRGMVNGDTLTGALATKANAQSNVGSYAITLGTVAASSNYALTFVPGALKVTPRPITITAIGQSRVYGDANPAFGFTVGGAGLVNGDTLTGELATIATETSNIGRYAITLGTLAATANYTLRFFGGRLTVTARPITVFADPQTRVFGTANPPLTYTVGGRGLVSGDVLTGELTTSATTSSRIGNYAINRGTLTGGSNYLMTYVGSTLTVTPTSPPPP